MGYVSHVTSSPFGIYDYKNQMKTYLFLMMMSKVVFVMNIRRGNNFTFCLKVFSQSRSTLLRFPFIISTETIRVIEPILE